MNEKNIKSMENFIQSIDEMDCKIPALERCKVFMAGKIFEEKFNSGSNFNQTWLRDFLVKEEYVNEYLYDEVCTNITDFYKCMSSIICINSKLYKVDWITNYDEENLKFCVINTYVTEVVKTFCKDQIIYEKK